MQFKDECKPGFSYRTLKTVSGVIRVTLSIVVNSFILTLSSVLSVSVLERFDCTPLGMHYST